MNVPRAAVEQTLINLIVRLGKSIAKLNTNYFSEDVAHSIGKFCPVLTTITLVHCDDRLLKSLALHAKTVRRIGIKHGYISDDGMADLLTLCPQLQEIRIGSASKVTSLTLTTIVSLKHKLKRLTWSGNTGIGSASSRFPLWNEQAAVSNFCDAMREQQLVPVPLVANVLRPVNVRLHREICETVNMFTDPLLG